MSEVNRDCIGFISHRALIGPLQLPPSSRPIRYKIKLTNSVTWLRAFANFDLSFCSHWLLVSSFLIDLFNYFGLRNVIELCSNIVVLRAFSTRLTARKTKPNHAVYISIKCFRSVTFFNKWNERLSSCFPSQSITRTRRDLPTN